MPFDRQLLEPVKRGFDPSLLEPAKEDPDPMFRRQASVKELSDRIGLLPHEIARKRQEEIDAMKGAEDPAVLQQFLEKIERDEAAGAIREDTSSWWERFRASDLGIRIFGYPKELQARYEAETGAQMANMGGIPSPVEAAQDIIHKLSLPPQVTEPIVGAVGHATKDLPAPIAGPIRGVSSAALGLVSVLPAISAVKAMGIPNAMRVASGAFAADMALQLPEIKGELDRAVAEGDSTKAWEMATQLALTPGFIAGAAAHAAKPGARAVEPLAPVVEREAALGGAPVIEAARIAEVSNAPATAEALKAQAATAIGARAEVVVDNSDALLQEAGVSPENVRQLMLGTKTPEQVAFEQLGEASTPEAAQRIKDLIDLKKKWQLSPNVLAKPPPPSPVTVTPQAAPPGAPPPTVPPGGGGGGGGGGRGGGRGGAGGRGGGGTPSPTPPPGRKGPAIPPPTRRAPFQKPERPVGTPYEEPLATALRRRGGVVSKRVADEAQQIAADQKGIMGDLRVDKGLDEALSEAGSAGPTTTYFGGKENVTPRAAIGRFNSAMDTRAATGNWAHVPAKYQRVAQRWFDVNFEIGNLAQRANPSFKPSGLAQRIWTNYGLDVVRRGKGKAWDAMVDGAVAANPGLTKATVETLLNRFKAALDAPDTDAATMDKIAQDFSRDIKRFPTHVKPGFAWHEIIESKPFGYLDMASKRTASAVAFRRFYPVGSGALPATRAAVMKELSTDRHKSDFDSLMRALQGHPADTFSSGWTAPDTLLGSSARMVKEVVLDPLKALRLTRNFVTNIPETLRGSAEIYFGTRRAYKAMAQKIIGTINKRSRSGQLIQDLERQGAIDPVVRNWAFNPDSPIRSASRIVQNTIHRVFITGVLNELQEFKNAAVARQVADEVRAGTASPGTRRDLEAAMRMMDIPRNKAVAAANGLDMQTLKQFEIRAATEMSGGNITLGEKSRLGVSRLFQSNFWYQGYSMMKNRQLAGILNNIIEDFRSKRPKEAMANSIRLADYLGSTALAGGLYILMTEYFKSGTTGAQIKASEAKDDWVQFLIASALQGQGGPVQAIHQVGQDASTIKEWGVSAAQMAVPVDLAQEFQDLFSGTGKYAGRDTMEKIGQLMYSNTPGIQPVKRAFAMWGLAKYDAEFDAARRAFYRWQKSEFKTSKPPVFPYTEFRANMRRAVEAKQNGDEAAFDKFLDKAADVAESKQSIKRSFESRKIMKDPETQKPLSTEQQEALKKRIGDRAFQKLEDFDAMLEVLSR